MTCCTFFVGQFGMPLNLSAIVLEDKIAAAVSLLRHHTCRFEHERGRCFTDDVDVLLSSCSNSGKNRQNFSCILKILYQFSLDFDFRFA